VFHGDRQRRRARGYRLGRPGGATAAVGDGITELRVSVPEPGRRQLPLPVAVWHATVGKGVVDDIAKGDEVLVHGHLVRRFYRSGAGARSLTEVVASGIKRLGEAAEAVDDVEGIRP
jgi:hypothetical protein